VIASPVFIVFFWVRVSYLLHWTAPLLILGYYFLTYIVQKFVMSPIVHHVYLQEKLEGITTQLYAYVCVYIYIFVCMYVEMLIRLSM